MVKYEIPPRPCEGVESMPCPNGGVIERPNSPRQLRCEACSKEHKRLWDLEASQTKRYPRSYEQEKKYTLAKGLKKLYGG